MRYLPKLKQLLELAKNIDEVCAELRRLVILTEASAYLIAGSTGSSANLRYVELEPHGEWARSLAYTHFAKIAQLVGQLEEAMRFASDARLLRACSIEGPELPSYGVVLPLANRSQGGESFMVLPTSSMRTEQAIWDNRAAITRIGDVAYDAICRYRRVSISLSPEDKLMVKLSRLKFPMKTVADKLNVSITTVKVRRQKLCDLLGVDQFDDALCLLAP